MLRDLLGCWCWCCCSCFVVVVVVVGGGGGGAGVGGVGFAGGVGGGVGLRLWLGLGCKGFRLERAGLIRLESEDGGSLSIVSFYIYYKTITPQTRSPTPHALLFLSQLTLNPKP